MRETSSLWSWLRPLLIYTLQQAVAFLVTFCSLVLFSVIVKQIFAFQASGSNEKLYLLLSRITQWAELSLVTLFAVQTVLFIVFRAYFSARTTLARASQEGGLFDQTGRKNILSYIAGFAGLVFVFALLHRGAATGDLLSKVLIYVAAFLLGLEVLFMASVRTIDRVRSTIPRVTHGSAAALT